MSLATREGMNKRVVAALTTATLILAAAPLAKAEEASLKKKSMAVATFLGIDPIPGDALYYAQAKGQAVANIVVGGAGLALMIAGVAVAASTDDDWDSDDANISRGFGIGLPGALLYFSAYFWDLFGGLAATHNHNQLIESSRKRSLLHGIQPTFAVTDQGAMVGAQVQF
jgi:hypothetical protein